MNDPVVSISECDIIKCSNCNRKLMIVPTHEAGEQTLYRVQVDCPWCGDHSYDYEVKGPLKYHLADGVKMKDFIEKDGRVRFVTTK